MAQSPAASPEPAKRSARTAPLMAPPVSWASTKRLRAGRKVGADSHKALPNGMLKGSMATEDMGMRAVPQAPLGPATLLPVSADKGAMAKKM